MTETLRRPLKPPATHGWRFGVSEALRYRKPLGPSSGRDLIEHVIESLSIVHLGSQTA